MRRTVLALLAVALLVPTAASAATLYIDPSQGTFGPGDTFSASIRLNTEGDCVNAGEVTVVYPKDILRATDFSRGHSIFSLWVQEPKINNENGTVVFSGGVPGGYCGRIPGDPSLTNVLGKVIFTVTSASQKTAVISIAPTSKLYANDGLGTIITPTIHSGSFTIAEDRQNAEDPWIKEVQSDTIPPDAFEVQVEAIQSIFGAKYYLIFTTVDKQSGLDHFEISEKGAWKSIQSPYELRNQSIHSNIQVRAVDKAGNARLGTYKESVVHVTSNGGETTFFILGLVCLLALLLLARHYLNRRGNHSANDVA